MSPIQDLLTICICLVGRFYVIDKFMELISIMVTKRTVFIPVLEVLVGGYRNPWKFAETGQPDSAPEKRICPVGKCDLWVGGTNGHLVCSVVEWDPQELISVLWRADQGKLTRALGTPTRISQ